MLLNADFAKLASLTKNPGKTQIFLEQSAFGKGQRPTVAGDDEMIQ